MINNELSVEKIIQNISKYIEHLSPVKVGLLLSLTGSLLYVPSLWNDFVWDDINNIVSGDRLRSWSSLTEVFKKPAMWSAAQATGPVGTYRPLSLALMILEFKTYGLHASGYHLTNVILHAVCIFFTAQFLMEFGYSRHTTVLVTLLWATHPAHVEAIGWINGRSEPISFFPGILALTLALKQTKQFSVLRCVGISVALLLSLLGKETGAVFSILCAFWIIANRNKIYILHLWLTLTATIFPVFLYAFFRFNALGNHTMPSATIPWTSIPLTFSAIFFKCMESFILPLNRSIIMIGDWLTDIPGYMHLIYSFFTFVIGLLFIFSIYKKQTKVVFGLLWWMIGIAPATILAIMNWPGLYRWLYIPSIGLFIVLRQVFEIVRKRYNSFRSAHIFQVISIAVIGYVILTSISIQTWKNEGTLWKQVVRENPSSSYALGEWGADKFWSGDYRSAKKIFSKALYLNPENSFAADHLTITLARLKECENANIVFKNTRKHRVPLNIIQQEISLCFKQRP